MQTIHVQASRPYDIVIGRGLLDKAGAMARQVNSGARALIVSDSHVAPLYADRVLAGFQEAATPSPCSPLRQGRSASASPPSSRSMPGWRRKISPGVTCWRPWAAVSPGI